MLFYFTGTGNSLYVAKQLETNYISIPQALKQDKLVFEDERIGIVCPVYGHEMPKMVKEFIKKATFKTDYFYVVLTYGAMHGGCVELANNYLQSVGKKANYMTTMKMVDNFLPNFDMNEQCALDKQEDMHIANIKADIDSFKQGYQKVSFKDCFVHKMYLRMVKNQPETVWSAFKVEETCVGCGICTRVCPSSSVKLENNKAVHTLENCQVCYACVHACPKKAIKFTIEEKNPNVRYRHKHVELSEIIEANQQGE